MAYTNSSLVEFTRLSPNHSGQRTHAIDRITPHCVVGQCSVETLGSIFAPTSKQASCNYGIGAEAPELAMAFRVNSVPCLVLLKNGQFVDQSIGFKPEPMITAWIQENL